MNKLVAILALGVCFSNVYAKGPKKNKAEEEGFVFTTVKENPITSIKDQNQSSTCWSFSTLGFLEAELLRAGKGEFDLSEMFVVHKTMEDRAVNYVRYHGDASFSPGGSFEDIVVCYEKYESYKIMTLNELMNEQTDMFTTVFVGNSQTRVINEVASFL